MALSQQEPLEIQNQGGRAGGRGDRGGVTPAAYLSVMAICSSMAEPVLAFQFPEMDVLLRKRSKKIPRSSLLKLAGAALIARSAVTERHPHLRHVYVMTCFQGEAGGINPDEIRLWPPRPSTSSRANV